MGAELVFEERFDPGQHFEVPPLALPPNRPAYLAVEVFFSTTESEPACRYPLSYTIRAVDGRLVAKEESAIDCRSGNRRSLRSGETFRMKTSFRRFTAPDEPIQAAIQMEPAASAPAPEHIAIQLYANAPSPAPLFVGGTLVLLLGGGLFAAGVIALAVTTETPPPSPVPTSTPPDRTVRNWAMLCHLTALTAYIGIPFGHIIGPLVVWLLKREDDPLIEDQGKESLNFQISVTLYVLVTVALMFVIIGFPLFFAVTLFHFIMTVVAAVKASEGTAYRYPLTLRLIK